MDRRTLLATCAAGLAGCSGLGSGGSRSPDLVEEGAAHDGVAVEIRPPVAAIPTPDVGSTSHVDVAAVAGEQFLPCRVSGADESTIEALDVAVDGERLDARQYRLDTFEASPVAFRVPVADVASAAVVRLDRTVRWAVPTDYVEDLRHRPSFRVRRFETPDAVAPGERIPVALAVENVGGRDGRFLAELGTTLISDTDETSFRVRQGETVEVEVPVTPPLRTPPGDVDRFRVVLDWGLDRRDRTVRVEGSTPTATG